MNRYSLSALALSTLLFSGCEQEDMDFGASGADHYAPPTGAHGGEIYQSAGINPFIDPNEDPLATFAIDVDTASYTLMRSDVEAGRLPTKEGVRVEEYVNYFDYRDRPPSEDTNPFAIHTEIAPSPFGEELHLLRVALKGYEIVAEERKHSNLVFLVDVSGSMNTVGKLGLVREGLTRLTHSLSPDDTIGIVTYAGADRIALRPTPVRSIELIKEAIDTLSAAGSTNGEAGIRTAYRLAEEAMRPDGINRVILCSDGDFNVGVTGAPLITLIDDFRERGIGLSVFGFGRGNYNDSQMEQLADHGNGNYAFIDDTREVQRVMVDNINGTLQTIAKDVKIQVEFEPNLITRYRLIGYENRDIADQDFRDDGVDAGEIGAGHTVTAFFELELKANIEPSEQVLAWVRVRHKAPEATIEEEAKEILHTVHAADPLLSLDEASDAFRFGAAVVEFAEILRESPYSSGARFGEVATLAHEVAQSGDHLMIEFEALVRQAATL